MWDQTTTFGELMTNKTAWIACLVAAIAIVVAGAFWHRTSTELRQLQIGELGSIAALLMEDQQLLQALQTNAALGKDSGVLASYLAQIRADGVAKQADMMQRLDRLAENNSAIVTLINVYTPRAKTAAFAAEADKFRRYAIAWRDRWNSVMELFMAGGNYAVAEVPFPQEFIGAVQTEMESAKSAF
jgi:hypothetical protein